MKIKAIFSDGGGILFDDAYHRERHYNFLKQHIAISEADFRKGFQEFKERAQTQRGYSSNDAFRDYLAANGWGHYYEQFLQEQPKDVIKLYDDIIETLKKLKEKGICFVVLSDTSLEGKDIEKKLAEIGVDNIDGVVSSVDVGIKKPAKKFFDYVLREHGLAKDEVIFLGHSMDELEGAAAHGFRVAALNYDRADDLQFIPSELKLSRFGDLLNIIAQAQTAPQYNQEHQAQ